jgi:hypothetical protein
VEEVEAIEVDPSVVEEAAVAEEADRISTPDRQSMS